MINDPEKGSISIAFVREALTCLQQRGLDAEPFARRAGLSPRMLATDEARVTPQVFGMLWLDIAATLDDEFFGLDSRRMKVGSYATMCRLAVHCENLQIALKRAVQFINLMLDDTRVVVSTEARETRITLVENPKPGIEPGSERTVFAHETLFVLIQGLLCWLIGRRIPIQQARFAYARPQWSREYSNLFCHNLDFDQAQTFITFSSSWLRAAVIQDEISAQEFLKGAPGNFLLKYRNDKSLSARVRQRLRRTQPDAWPSFARMGTELNTPVSTLHRKLKNEGTSFQLLKDELRRDEAIRLLSHSALNIGDVATALGFLEPSAFHRAFKKWTGLKPGDYRLGDLQSF